MSDVVCTADLRFAGVVQTSVDICLPALVCTNVQCVTQITAKCRLNPAEGVAPRATNQGF
jgi:hypothetical protein